MSGGLRWSASGLRPPGLRPCASGLVVRFLDRTTHHPPDTPSRPATTTAGGLDHLNPKETHAT